MGTSGGCSVAGGDLRWHFSSPVSCLYGLGEVAELLGKSYDICQMKIINNVTVRIK